MLEETPRWTAQEVGSIARQTQLLGRVVTLKIRFHPFETHTRSRTLKVPTADRDITAHYSKPGLARLLEEVERVRRPEEEERLKLISVVG